MANITGTNLRNILRGTGLADTIRGLGGNDDLFGGFGDDLIFGGVGNDKLFGQSGNDRIVGDAGNDILDGGSGSDNMRGGTGNDTYTVNSNGDRVIELAGQGTDLVRTNMSFTMGSNIERLTLTGSLNISGFGNTLGNLVTGNAGRNLLMGRGGNDTVLGAAGIDDLFGDDGNDILRGGLGNDTVRGGRGVDQLFGDGGNDSLDGGLGTDTMRGGLGDDTYIVDAAGDRAIELAGQGTDRVLAGASFILGSAVENLTLVGLAALDGTGNTLANFITGNSGNNTLDGGEGNDSLFGGAGTDVLNGGNGDDFLRPGPGNGVPDTINGGVGSDTVDYSDALGRVAVILAFSVFTDEAAGDAGSDVENVIGSRFGDELMPSDVDFSLAAGGPGNDALSGSAGVYDRIRGDDGFDRLSGRVGSADDFWLQYHRGFDWLINYRSGIDEDHIVVDSDEFNLATSAGFLNPSKFQSNGLLEASNPAIRFLYDVATRLLFADKDGSGTAFDPVPIALMHSSSEDPAASNIFVF